MNIYEFLEKAIANGTIAKDALDKNRLELTKTLFDKADAKLNAAILDQNLKLKDKIKNGTIDPNVISLGRITETFNNKIESRPVIDLVQQGGGMYGIALLGYTYIMEKIGIRFYSHGGTSAGAINASFLAAIPNSIYECHSIFSEPGVPRQATKSELLTHVITHTDFSSFMGTQGIIGRIQRSLFKRFKSKVLRFSLLATLLLFLVICFGAFGIIYSTGNGLSGLEIRYFDFIIGTLNIFALMLLIYILFVKVLGPSFGINSGDEFYRWADTLFALVGIRNTEDFDTRLSETKISPSEPTDLARLVLISSNLTHNRIVKFPERAVDYWGNSQKVKPAAYLRATMSIPFIYKTFVPERKHYDQPDDDDQILLKARFVDGGMLSNFPIREFHKTNGNPPRFPTFGVLLSDIGLNHRTQIANIDKNKLPNSTLLQYLTSFFKTFRNFYDYEFIFSNDEIKQRVVTVDTEKFNWLNFWMDDPTKTELFLAGVDAAIAQIDKFQWHEYAPKRTPEKKKTQNPST
ncbi:patatin-like phospholipase family protein [Zobellia galactanivorans]|uniref:patatin-like phospholipase family protein n=1 Tax=Zobellia galactanivorans (strain DSM 12802 / CCUG 47099 / CIP 106680 / NCIMB 13871 / Dsij) TaxID=63186 RepID=UPI001C06FFCF|nr:patatin-like phospholipase family protein [Zobellia galactanivorans]MBU3024870.1 patatin-like phospholipase family protein [Zobellia galactanivorans]